GRVAEREDEEDRQEGLEASGERCQRDRSGLRRGGRRRFVAHEGEDCQNRERAGNRRQPENAADLPASGEEPRGDGRTGHRAGRSGKTISPPTSERKLTSPRAQIVGGSRRVSGFTEGIGRQCP